MIVRVLLLTMLCAPFVRCGEAASVIPPDQREFFEKKIRPVLAQECYECHSSATKSKGGLTLDTRKGWQDGGNSGAVIIPGDIKNSLLLQSVRHEDPELKMPKAGAKFDAQTLHDFEAWVKMGAPDPRDVAPTPEQIAADRAWPPVLERRKNWWSFQPLQTRPIPVLATQPPNPIDAFLQEKLTAAGLSPADDAEPGAMCRRLYLVLTGLPPTPEDVAAFEAAWKADRSGAVAKTADALLASPRFGERWARHWMDWVRYAESHGSEGDPAIPFAWRYRDYLIRALNADVPYPQLVREQIAGDLIANPRINAESGINESALGTAQLRMVLHGFTPTDAHDELVTVTDNQIDTVSKSLLGITISCARCHNHKFDAISQADFYAWFGIFTSCRPALLDVNTPERKVLHIPKLTEMKTGLRKELAAAWLADVDNAVGKLAAEKDTKKLGETPAFTAWAKLAGNEKDFDAAWKRMQGEWNDEVKRLADFHAQPVNAAWNFRADGASQWLRDGPVLNPQATPAGDFIVAPEGDRVVAALFPSGTISSTLSTKHRAVLSSPPMKAEGGKLWVRLRGSKTTARYVVRNYPRSGLIYPKYEANSETDQWIGWGLDYWKGDSIHFEITTGGDHPVETSGTDRSWYAVSDVIYAKDGKLPAPRIVEGSLFALAENKTPAASGDLKTLYADGLRRSIEHWRDGKISDDEAEFLAAFVRRDWLKNKLAELPTVAPLVGEYRKLEAQVPVPTRSPGLLEGFASDSPLFVRGDHKKPDAPIARHFLDALDSRPFNPGEHASGRLQLAECIAAPTNPLTSRVLVNRLWHYTFGRGIFPTPDNTGRLGEVPSHPELLDYLATRFQAEGGSIKSMLRLLVTSRAFRQSHRATAEALQRDPENKLLSHYAMERMDAETLRDTLVALTGRLDTTVGGGPADGNSNRRSVYVRVIRNNLDPLLCAFDFPVPSATRGARDITNVPAQSLALLNSPQISRWSGDWVRRIRGDARWKTDSDRVARMYSEAFARAPGEKELSDALAFVAAQTDAKTAIQTELSAAEAAKNEESVKALREELNRASAPEYPLQCLAQALINAKEFIYVR